MKYYLVLITENNGGYEYTYRKPFKVKDDKELDTQISDMLSDWYEGELSNIEDSVYSFTNGNTVHVDGLQEIPEFHYDILVQYL